jgi:GT2 family glycosyltransferase
MALVILGMHRSGTSLLTRICNLLGADVGPDVMPPGPDNPTGFWEHRGVVAANDRILAELGLSWRDPLPLPDDWLSRSSLARSKESVCAMLEADFASSALPCIKDPRLCRLIPFWEQVFDALSWEPRYVLVGRNPLEIQHSLATRNGLRPGVSLLLWLRYSLEAERLTRSRQRAFVSYESLLDGWAPALGKVGESLGIVWPALDQDRSGEIDAFVHPELRHHRYTDNDVKDDARLPAIVWETLRAFRKAEEHPSQAATLCAGVDRELDRYVSLIDPLLDELARQGTGLAQGRLEEVERARTESAALIAQHNRDAVEIEHLKGEARAAQGIAEARAGEIRQLAAAYKNKEQEALGLATERDLIGQQRNRLAQEHDRERRAWQEQRERLEQELQVAREQREHLARELEQERQAAQEQRERLEQERQVTREHLARELEQERQAAQEQRERLEQERQAVREQREHLAQGLEQERQAAQEQRERLKQERQVVREQREHLAQELEQERQAAQEQRERLKQEREQTINALREEWVERLEQLGAEHESQMSELRGRLENRERELAEARDLADVLRKERQELELKCDYMYYSMSWKLTHPFRVIWRGFSRVTPSRLKMAVRHLPRAFLVLRSQGPRALWEKAGRRLRSVPSSAQAPALLQGLSEDYAPLSLREGGQPKASIVIPVFNNLPYTYNCLAALAEHDSRYEFEVIVVNDASTDHTERVLGRVQGLRLLNNERNFGFVRSCNRGAATATGDYVIFLNNDTQVQDGWLDALIDTFSNRDDAGVVGSRLIYPDGRQQEAGGIVWQDGSAWNYGRLDDPNRPEYSYLRAVDYCSGASLAVRRTIFQELGGFDEHYAPAYYEDTDFAFRVREHGYQVYYQPLSVVVHFEGVSSGTDETDASNVKRYQILNREKFFARWSQALQSHRPNGVEPELEKERSARRRILVADAYMITPDRESGSLRMANLLRILQELGYKVTFAPLNLEAREPYVRDLQKQGVECLYTPYVTSVAEHLKQRGSVYDAIMLSRADVAEELMRAVRTHCPKARVIFDTVDLHHLRELREARLKDDRKLLQAAERRKTQELNLIKAADTTLVVSPVEQQLLALEVPRADIQVVSNIHEIYGSQTPFADRQDILFIGGFAHPPNVDAVAFFAAEILPTVLESLPNLVFYVVGNNPPAELRDLESEHIRVTGYVPDVDPFFRSCRVSVAPLRYGAGVKGKVNLSMAYGLPVVGTSVAVEGMHLAHGKSVLVANEPEEFAHRLLELYSGERLWNRLSANSIEVMQRYFSLNAAKEALSRVLAVD